MIDFDNGRYDNVDAATRASIQELKDLFESSQPSVKGIWIQIEVPKINASNVDSLGVILNAWQDD